MAGGLVKTSFLDRLIEKDQNDLIQSSYKSSVSLKGTQISPLLSKNQRTKLAHAHTNQNAGDKWFNMARSEMDENVERDIDILKNRSDLPGKNFYKKLDWVQGEPKFLQIGTVKAGHVIDTSNLAHGNQKADKSMFDRSELRRQSESLNQKQKLLKKAKQQSKFMNKWKKRVNLEDNRNHLTKSRNC